MWGDGHAEIASGERFFVQETKAGPARTGTTGPTSASSGSSARDNVRYVDQALYAQLKAAAGRAVTRTQPGDLAGAAKEAVEACLNREARLLDLGRYRDWLDLLTDDCVYWVLGDSGDPLAHAAINFDDRRRLIDRIVLIETGDQIAQIPRSRTCRTVTNIEGWSAGSGIEVRSNLVAWEQRRGRVTSFAGWQTHHLVPDGPGWKIRWKIIGLIDAEQPQSNLTFIV
jgi:3-phenylpropionate/cinnamic acid dioxygenase small subunit